MKTGTESNRRIMSFDTTRFGPVAISEDKIIHFVQGIPGFKDVRRYILIDHDEDGVFRWLQAVDRPEVAFLLTNPVLFKSDYNIVLRTGELRTLGAEDPEHLVIFVMVCFHRESNTMTLNLKGPVVLNSLNMRGIQLILDRDDYPVDYPVPVRTSTEQKRKSG